METQSWTRNLFVNSLTLSSIQLFGGLLHTVINLINQGGLVYLYQLVHTARGEARAQKTRVHTSIYTSKKNLVRGKIQKLITESLCFSLVHVHSESPTWLHHCTQLTIINYYACSIYSVCPKLQFVLTFLMYYFIFRHSICLFFETEHSIYLNVKKNIRIYRKAKMNCNLVQRQNIFCSFSRKYTTTETYNSPGWKLVFIPVFQPGLCSRDKCTPSFYPGNYGTGINEIFHKQKKSTLRTQLVYARMPFSPIPNVSP